MVQGTRREWVENNKEDKANETAEEIEARLFGTCGGDLIEDGRSLID